MTPSAAIFGCSGHSLTSDERRFFREIDPLGFILFARNCDRPEQVRALVQAMRETVGRADAPILIDQEGGRVARLRPPLWRAAPPSAAFGELADRDLDLAREATRLNARLLAADLADLGISVDCAPLLDLHLPETHGVIGDRAFGSDPDRVAELGRAACEGFLAGGVIPVIKHIPGHGRATVDSHHDLPIVETPLETLRETDFRAFRSLRDAPWAMTAHVIYTAVDRERPATASAAVIDSVIRREIGFEGLLLSDDLSMKALTGGLGDRTRAALEAGCDVVLHCNGEMTEMRAVAEALRPLSAAARDRLRIGAAQAERRDQVDLAAATARLHLLLQG